MNNGKTTHFSKYGELPCIRAKQINRGIPMFVEDGKLRFKLRKMQFGIQVNDRFQSDEVNAVLSYLENPDKMDADAVKYAYRRSLLYRYLQTLLCYSCSKVDKR